MSSNLKLLEYCIITLFHAIMSKSQGGVGCLGGKLPPCPPPPPPDETLVIDGVLIRYSNLPGGTLYL